MKQCIERCGRLSGIAIILLFIILTFSFDGVRADDVIYGSQISGRILFISSYSYAWDTVQIQIEGIKEGIGSEAVIDYEFMDTKRFDNETHLEMFFEGLKYRMENVADYDVVIVGDDAALQFALKYRDELFKDIPIIFEGVNDENLAIETSSDPLITGVLEKLSFDKNIEFALSIYPDAKKVVGIIDDSVTGQIEKRQLYSHEDMYPELEFLDINTSRLTTDELIDAIASVEEDTILIYIVMTEDASGIKYTNSESIDMLVEYGKVPAFRMVSGGIGEGLLGGNIVSMRLSGKIAGRIAINIINGDAPEAFDVVVESPNIYCVDEDVMRKYNIDLSLIPDGAEIINHRQSFLEKYKAVFIPALIIVFLLVVIMTIVIMDNIHRRKTEKELERAKKHLQHINCHDALTGIGNRRKLSEDLNQLIDEKTPCAVMMMDIDNFKNINDSMGHNKGDEALKQIGLRLQRISSNILVPYRFAGDEFVVIIKSGDIKEIEKCADSCMGIFESPFRFDGELWNIYASMGISIYEEGDTVLNLIGYADSAMYKVKNSGKNNYAFYKKY